MTTMPDFSLCKILTGNYWVCPEIIRKKEEVKRKGFFGLSRKTLKYRYGGRYRV
jgi:hypothetical protein